MRRQRPAQPLSCHVHADHRRAVSPSRPRDYTRSCQLPSSCQLLPRQFPSYCRQSGGLRISPQWQYGPVGRKARRPLPRLGAVPLESRRYRETTGKHVPGGSMGHGLRSPHWFGQPVVQAGGRLWRSDAGRRRSVQTSAKRQRAGRVS